MDVLPEEPFVLPPEDPELLAQQLAIVREQNLSRAETMLDAAARAEIALKTQDVAVLVGEEELSYRGLAWQGVKHVARYVPPFAAKSIWQKRRAVINVLHGDALAEDTERDMGLALATWISDCTPAERERIELVDMAYGDGLLTELRLTVPPMHEGDEEKEFPLGRHFAFDTEETMYASLPDAVRERIAERRAFWERFGVHNGVELEEFIDTHFDRIAVDFRDPDKIPPELLWLKACDKAAYEAVVRAQEATGERVYFWRMKKTPDVLVEDVLRIANTQEHYISTWLHNWVKREGTPVILDEDIAALQVAHQGMRAVLEGAKDTGLSDFRRELLLRSLDAGLAKDIDFDRSLDNMQLMRRLVLGLELDSAGDPAIATAMAHANDLLDRELSGERVADRLIVDTVLHTSEGIRQMLKVVAMLVPMAYALESVPVPAIADTAKAVGSGDDLAAEVGELQSLRASGMRWEKIRSRFGVILPVAAGAVALGTLVETISEAPIPFSGKVAATLFALTTFITSGVTLALTARTFKQGYMHLAEQGKLKHQGYLTSDERAAMRSALEATADQETLAVVREFAAHLAGHSDISPQQLAKRIAGMEEAVRQGKHHEVDDQLRPSDAEAWRAAYHEVFKINPAREGKLWTMPLMLVSAAALGKVLLSNPLFYVFFGMGEAAGGLGRAQYASMTENRHWRRKVEQLTAALQTTTSEPAA